MMSIRNYSTPLRHVDVSVAKKANVTDGADASMQEVKKKKLIKVDKKLLNPNSSEDVCESDLILVC